MGLRPASTQDIGASRGCKHDDMLLLLLSFSAVLPGAPPTTILYCLWFDVQGHNEYCTMCLSPPTFEKPGNFSRGFHIMMNLLQRAKGSMSFFSCLMMRTPEYLSNPMM